MSKPGRYITALLTTFAVGGVSIGEAHAATTIENFVGICLISNAKYEAVEALATIAGWTKPPEEYLPLLAPQVTPTKWDAWMFVDNGETIFVAASRGTFDGAPVDSCVVAGRSSRAEIDAALSAFSPKLIDEVDEVVQLTRVYSVSRSGNEMLVTVLSAPDDSSDIFIVSASDIPDDAF